MSCRWEYVIFLEQIWKRYEYYVRGIVGMVYGGCGFDVVTDVAAGLSVSTVKMQRGMMIVYMRDLQNQEFVERIRFALGQFLDLTSG